MDSGFPSTVRLIDGTQITNNKTRHQELRNMDMWTGFFFFFLCTGEIIDVFEKETFLLSQ